MSLKSKLADKCKFCLCKVKAFCVFGIFSPVFAVNHSVNRSVQQNKVFWCVFATQAAGKSVMQFPFTDFKSAMGDIAIPILNEICCHSAAIVEGVIPTGCFVVKIFAKVK